MFIEALGWIGMACILFAYYLISNDKVTNHSRSYQLINLVGAVCIVINASYKEAWAVVTLDLFWAAIALVALIKGSASGEKS